MSELGVGIHWINFIPMMHTSSMGVTLGTSAQPAEDDPLIRVICPSSWATGLYGNFIKQNKGESCAVPGRWY
ncbi:hypothetical protein J6590_010676 [Homalodisca vitripennis]|nr:hypothetical protein J6590_010676 [Homalodisca vitripennis]